MSRKIQKRDIHPFEMQKGLLQPGGSLPCHNLRGS